MSTNEERNTRSVREQGRANGLFRKCMDQIKTSHTVGQGLRSAALAAGLMTDRKCYAELLSQFYVATRALQAAMDNAQGPLSSSSSRTWQPAASLGYGPKFTEGYAKDLAHLLGDGWQDIVDGWTTAPAREYAALLEGADECQLVAAIFILHGPLVIGGGAALKPRVRKAFGNDATNVFECVVGPGRGKRRKEFIECFDGLLGEEVKDMAAKEKSIVAACGKFMALNNEMMMAVTQRPWWSKYLWAGAAGAGLLVGFQLWKRRASAV